MSTKVLNFVSNSWFQSNGSSSSDGVSNGYVITTFTSNNYVQGLGFTTNAGDVTNTYLTSTFVSNNYLEDIKSTFGTGDVTNTYLTSTFVSNNYLEDIKSTFGTGDVTNTYLIATYTSNNYIQTKLDLKATNTYVNSTFASNNYIDGKFTSNNFVKATFSTNNYNASTYTSNNYVSDIYVSNNYLQAQGYGTGDVSNNYAQDTFASNGFVTSTFSSNNYNLSIFTSNSYVQDRYVSNNYLDISLDSFSSNAYLQDTFASNTYVVDIFSSNNYLQDQLDLKATNTYVNSTFTSNNYVDGKFASNTFLTDTFTTNNYVDGRFTSNNYIGDNFTSNTFLVATFASNNYITNHYTTNNYIQTYVAAQVASVVDSAPATLDTLNELAAALGDDANFSTTVTTSIGLRATNTYVNSTFSSNNYLQGQLGTKLNSSSYTASDVLTKIKTVDGSGSGLDADLLDGIQVTGLVSNNYAQDTFVSNGFGTDTFSSNNYNLSIFTSNNYVDGKFTSNTFLTDMFTTNNYVDGRFTSNTYVISKYASNTYVTSKLGLRATNTYVNSTFTSNSYVDGRFTSNNFVKSIFTSNNYVDAQLGLKLDSSSYTASDVLTKIKTVDGSGSGLDADKLDGLEATAFATSAQGVLADSALQSSDIGVSVQAHATVLDNTTASYTTAEETKLAGIEIGATADQTGAEIKALYELEANAYTDTKDTKLSGIEAGATADQTASEILTAIKTVDGSGSGLDADTLDGLQGSSYVSNNYVDGRFTSNAFLVATFTTNNFIQSYVSSEVASLVDSAPATLDTLNELAAALGDDANFATTVSTQIGIRATNTYVNSTFSSNNYLQGLGYTTNTGDVSNNYLQSLGYTTNTGDVSNNYLQGLGFTTNVGDVTNTYLTATFSSNNYLQGQLGDKLNSSSYTASDVLTKIKTVDGSGSGLDADTLDSLQVTSLTSNNYLQGLGFTTNVGDVANAYLIATFTSNNYIQTQLGTKLNSSSYTASDVLTKVKTVDGSGSGLDADLLDGQEASAFQTVAAPNSPSITSTTVVNETIELVFGQSSTSGVTRYEVWSDGATGSDYSLISIIPSQDAAASMSVVDLSFDTGGTVAYRVYAIKNGVYSTAATTTKSFTIPSLDVTNMSVVSSITNYHIQYDLPETRFLDHIEIYKDAETTLVALSRTGAALIYSGSSDNFTYNVPPSDKAKFHQFWVEVVSV